MIGVHPSTFFYSEMSSDVEMASANGRDGSNKLLIEVGKLMFYQKPALGLQQGRNVSSQAENQPLQLIFPSGNFGLGIPLNLKAEDAATSRISDTATIYSYPEETGDDEIYRKYIKILFLSVFIVDLIITACMYGDASKVDFSRVQSYEGINFDFAQIPTQRSFQENVSFGFTIIILLVGAAGAALEQPTLLSGFCFGILLNFILGTMTLPFFAYSTRYLLDTFLLYMGLVLRQKCSPQFLPVSIRNQT